MRSGLLRRFCRDRAGSTAIEMAMILPLVALTTMGAVWAGMLTLTVSSLDYSVQSAARCASVNATLCGSDEATKTYAASLYTGPSVNPTFTSSASGCGHQVTAQANFDLDVVPGLNAVPVSVRACYP